MFSCSEMWWRGGNFNGSQGNETSLLEAEDEKESGR